MYAKVNGVEDSVIFINKQYKDHTKEVLPVKYSVSEITNVNENIIKDQSLVKSEFENLNERHLDLQTRSIRDNLIFEGILDTQEENTEEVFNDFLKSEMNIIEESQFQKVHIMGEKSAGTSSTNYSKICYTRRKRKCQNSCSTHTCWKAICN